MTVKNRYARGRGWAADTSAPQSVSHPRCSPASKLPLLGPCVSLFRIQRVAGSLPFFQSSKKVIWQFLLVFWDFCGKMCVCSCQHCHVAGLYLNLFWRQSLQRENSPAPRTRCPFQLCTVHPRGHLRVLLVEVTGCPWGSPEPSQTAFVIFVTLRHNYRFKVPGVLSVGMPLRLWSPGLFRLLYPHQTQSIYSWNIYQEINTGKYAICF